ncbi:MAG TPA: glycosyltransferase family 4 protein [Candidatus Limnocylindrales bacterium]|nr:glycosyltransferase family 4 protein [Candidatus Limnocylindrales bacterium]
MKVMMVDPWGTYNMYMYTNGLCESIADYIDLSLWTNYYYPKERALKYPVKRIFFKRSEYMKQGYPRNLIRLCEYYSGYFALIRELQQNKYDLVHIQWLLHYKSDIRFLTKIKKLCPKIVYTAHNVLPHRSGEKSCRDLKKIYSIVDAVLVHGEGVKEEFASQFADYIHKVEVQRHGPFTDQDLTYDTRTIEKKVLDKLQHYERVSIYFGNIFFNKGVDRLLRIWLEVFKNNRKHLLIIAGKKSGPYKELEELERDIIACDNILYIDHFIENNLLNFLVSQSQIVLLPYRHASMSGVIFTAAEFNKPVLSTKTGAIREYLLDGENSFLTENRDDHFSRALQHISENVSKETLALMGLKLHKHIRQNFSWEEIGKKLVDTVYNNTLL